MIRMYGDRMEEQILVFAVFFLYNYFRIVTEESPMLELYGGDNQTVMDTQKCKYLMAIAEQQSFSKAAEAMFVTQPYLSRLVLEMEEDLGVKLFRREKKQVTMTRAGEFFIEYCKNLVMLENNMKSELLNFSENIKGRIRIGMPAGNGSYILPQALKDFKQSFPEVEVLVDDGDNLISKLLDGNLDINFMCLPEYPEGLEYQLMRLEPILLVLPPGHPLGTSEAKGNYTDPPIIGREDIRRLRYDSFISLHKSKGIRLYADDIFRQCDFTPNTRYTFRNIETAYRMAANGNGYTFIPQIAAAFSSFSEPPFFFQISINSQEVCHRAHVFLYKKGRHLGIIEQALVDCVRKYA